MIPFDDPNDGLVIGQTPGANTQANEGSTVSFVVGQAAAPPTTTTTTTTTTLPPTTTTAAPTTTGAVEPDE